jgi:hypothetical protein
VWLNSTPRRAWPRNLRRDPRAALNVLNLENPYEYLEIRGQAIEFTEEGAEDHIDFLAQKYLGEETYPYRQPGDRRVIIKITPEWARRQG